MKQRASAISGKGVDEYLASLPQKSRTALQKLRRMVRAVAPEATERISYGIAAFDHEGLLVGFAAFEHHCSLYVMSRAVMAKFRTELKSYDTATATIRFLPEKPLPAALVKKLVKARIQENEARRKRVR